MSQFIKNLDSSVASFMLNKHYKLLILLILGFVFIVSILNAKNDSAIFDETAHIPAGYSYLKFHDMRLNPEHPPLIKDLAAFPLLFMPLKFDTSQDFWTTDVNGQWEAGHNLLWQMGNDADKIIFWSRIPIVLLSILLGLFIFKWTRELAGVGAGLLALTLYAFDPNVLGHNHFVTTDLGIATFMTFSFYYFLKFIREPTGKNIIIGGIFLGLLQLTKFSAVLAFPIYGLVLIVYPLTLVSRNSDRSQWSFRIKKLWEYFWKGAVAFAVSLVLVWGVYFINTYAMPQEKLDQTIDYYFPANDISAKVIYTNKVLTGLNNFSPTRPLSEYVLGVAMVFKRVEGGNGAYFMGQVSGQAFPAYFPTAFLIKEALPSLFLMLLAGLFFFSGLFKSLRERFEKSKKFASLSVFIRHNIVSISLLSFIALYTYISITSNLNIGFRHLFPILPFIYILTAKVVSEFIKKCSSPSKQTWSWVIIFSCLFLAAGTIFAYPYYMSYFNSAAGGPKNGYRYITDSNADWGQDLKRLKIFLGHHSEIQKIRVDYFGGADVKYYIGDKYLQWWDSKRPVEPGWYAISVNFLQGSLYDKEKKDNDSYRWIKNIKPVYQVGTSIFIYYVSDKDLDVIAIPLSGRSNPVI